MAPGRQPWHWSKNAHISILKQEAEGSTWNEARLLIPKAHSQKHPSFSKVTPLYPSQRAPPFERTNHSNVRESLGNLIQITAAGSLSDIH